MKKLSTTITEKNGSERVITVELENELAEWLMTQPAEIYEDFILFEYQARCVERKETRHTQSLDYARVSGFDVADESEDVVKAALQKCDREALQNAMKSLTDKQYQVLWLYAVDGLSFREIGELMGVHKNSVWEYYRAAVKKLQKILA